MFSSHSSLFAKAQGSQDVYPTECVGDFSQLQNAQCTQFEMFSENSQDNSQMFYSQNEDNSGSNSEGYKRTPVYEKYIAKPSLFGGRGRGRVNNMKNMNNGRGSQPMVHNTSSQNSIKVPSYMSIVSQKAKAKERDERDLLGSIVKMVKECSDEVKCSLVSFRESDDNKVDDLQNSVRMLATSFDESSTKILKAVEEKENHLQKIYSLERELLKKDEEIKALKQQKTNSSIEDNYSSMFDKMKNFVGDQHQQMEKKLQHVIETTQEQLSIVKDLNQNKKTSHEDGNKIFQDMKYTNQRQLHDVEKRLIDEIVQVRDDFDRQKRDVENFYRNQMQNFHQIQTRDLEQCLKQGIENAFQKSDFLTLRDIQDGHSELISKTQNQHKQMENHVKNTAKQQSDHLVKHCQESLKKHKDDLEKSLQDNFNSLKNQQLDFMENNKAQLQEIKEVTKMAWENENVPKHIQEQLNKLHNNHQSEIKRLEEEIKSQREKSKDTDDHEIKRHVAYGGPSMGNVYDENCDQDRPSQQTGPMFKKRVDFLSPRPFQSTRWNSKTLFGRTNPSPVATVHPQRQAAMAKAIPNRSDRSCTMVASTAAVTLPFRGGNAGQTDSQHDQLPSSSSQSTQANDYGFSADTNQTKQSASRKRKAPGRKRKGKKRGQAKKSKTTSNTNSESEVRTDPMTSYDDRHKNESYMSAPSVKSMSTPAVKSVYAPAAKSVLSSAVKSVYDFCDDETNLYRNQSGRGRKAFKDYSQQSNSCSPEQNKIATSFESSPSLSITEVMITRRVNGGPINSAEMVSNRSNKPNHSDIFNSPKAGMLELCQNETNNPGDMILNRQIQAPRMRDRRKLCDFDTHTTQVFQMIQCLQKNF